VERPAFHHTKLTRKNHDILMRLFNRHSDSDDPHIEGASATSSDEKKGRLQDIEGEAWLWGWMVDWPTLAALEERYCRCSRQIQRQLQTIGVKLPAGRPKKK